MSSSDDDVIFQKEEYTVYYYGNDPVIDLTQDDAASPASPGITQSVRQNWSLIMPSLILQVSS